MTSLRSTPVSASNKSTASSKAKPTAESTSGRLEIAEKLLLAPFGLTQAHLSRALGEITSHGADDADLYFQYTRSEGWSLEEGIVKTGSFSIDQGVGVRAVSGEKLPLLTPTIFLKPRCSTRRAPCAASPPAANRPA
jgi:TldD protein